MTRNLKSLGLLVAALLALGAMIASTASAHVPARFTSEQSSTTIRGVHDSGAEETKFTIAGWSVVCEIEEFHGTMSGTSAESITIKPAYTECSGPFLAAKVTGFGHYGEPAANQCDYVLKANGRADLVCPAGRDVTVEDDVCTVHIPTQSDLGTITYTTGTRNVKHDLTLDISLSGITATYTDEPVAFLCPFSGSGEVSNATLTGKATAWGQDPSSGAAVGVTWDATGA